MISIHLGRDAVEDLHNTYRWCEEQVAGLGQEFLLAVETALSSIRHFPNAYPVIHRDLHRCPVRRFPYLLFYNVRKSDVVLTACFHARRDPAFWQSELDFRRYV